MLRARHKRIVRRLWPGLRLIIAGSTALVIIAAALVRIVEPDTFTSMGVALWWAVVTVGTVGYGDVVPHDGIGRVVATVVILFGMAWVPAVTALVVQTLAREAPSAVADRERVEAALRDVLERLERIEQNQQAR